MKDCMIVGQAPIVEDNTLWLLSCYADTLLKIDWETKSVVGAYQIPGNEIKEYSHLAMTKIDNLIMIFPLRGDNTFCFDTIEEKFDKCIFSIGENEVDPKVKIALKTPDRNVLFVDCENNNIITWNPFTKGIQRRSIDVFIKTFEDEFDSSQPLFNNDYLLIDNTLILPVYGKNYYLRYDVKSGKGSFVKVKDDLRIIHVGGDNNRIIFTTDNEMELVVLNDDDKTEIGDLIEIRNAGGKNLSPFTLGDEIVYLPRNQRRVFVRRNNDFRIVDVPYGGDSIYPENDYNQYEAIFINNDKLYFQSRTNGDLFCYDPVKGTVDREEIRISDKLIQHIMNRNVTEREGVLFFENCLSSLQNYVESINLR